MSRSSGTYTAPTSGWKPAAEGSVIDSSDWNTLLDDIEAAVTESVYTGGLGATDNALVRTDGTDTKKAQGSTPTISDTGILSGVATFTLTAYTIGTLPAGTEGQIAYASDWDKNGGASTGSVVFHDGEAWRGVDTGTTTSGIAAPYNTVLPVISGTTTEGQTLSTTDGTWLQSPTSYTYQWKRDGVSIGGATANTYLLTSADVGAMITVTVTATNSAGSTQATSAAVGPVDVLFALLTDDSGSDYEYHEQTFSVSNGVTYEVTFSVVKQGTATAQGGVGLIDGFASAWYRFNPETGATAQGGAFLTALSAVDEGSTWKFGVRFTATGSSQLLRFYPAGFDLAGFGTIAATGSIEWDGPTLTAV